MAGQVGGLRFEAWTLPWSAGGFDRVVADIPVVTGSGLRKFGSFGSASINVPADYDRITDIVSPTVGSLIRVLDGSTIVHEFLAERVDHRLADNGLATIAGDDLASAFQRAVIYPFDYPDQPTTFPNHVWAGRNLLTNPGFESFGVTPETWELFNDQTGGGTFTLSDGVDTTAPAFVFNVSAATLETEIEADLGLVDDVLVTGTGVDNDDPWVIEVVDEPTPFVGLNLTVADLTGLTSTLTKTQVGFLTPTGWTKSQTISRGVTQVFGTYDNFELVTGTVDTGTFALLVNPGAITPSDPLLPSHNRFAGAQQVLRVTPGGTYQASIRINPVSGTDTYRFVIRSVDGDFIASDSGGLGSSTHTAGVWSTVSIANVVIPDNVTQIIFRFSNTNATGNPSGFRLDTATFLEGEAAATVGTIVTSLMDDASTDHSGDTRGTILDWVDYTGFDGTNDSTTTAWDDPGLSFTAHRGKPYANIFDDLVDLGYEWTLTPKATPAGGLTHDLDWYNKSAAGTDHTTAATPAINAGQSTLSGPVVQRIPRYTALLVEGEGGNYLEDKDGTAETNFGRLELYEGDTTLGDSASRTALSDELLSLESTNRTAVEVVVVRNNDHPIPLVDYLPGDNILFQIPPTLTKTARRIQQIAWRTGEPSVYTVTGSRVFGGEAAAWEGLNRLLNKFTPLEDPDTSGSGVIDAGDSLAGMATVMIAANDSSGRDIEIADVVATGTDDDEAFSRVAALLPATGGEIVVAEGSYTFGSGSVDFGSLPITVRGLGHPVITLGGAVTFTGTGDSVYDGLAFTGGSSGEEVIRNTSSNSVFIVRNCIFRTMTVKAVIRIFHGSGAGHHFVVENCNFENITLAGGGGASPRGIIWGDDGAAGTRRGTAEGNYFLNITGTIVDTNGGLQLVAIGNVLENSTGLREGNWSHNWINGTYEAGDHSGTDPSLSRSVEFSDQRTVLTTGSGSQKWVAPVAVTIVDVQLAVGTSPTGADLIVDVHKNTVTIFTTQGNRPTVPAGDADGVGAAATPDVTAMTAGQFLTVDIDQIGSTIAGGKLTVVIEWRPT